MNNLLLKNRITTYFILLLLFICAGVYWNTLSNDFVAGDRQFILRNEYIGDFGTVVSSFTSDYWRKLGGEPFVYYRPLVILAHFIDFQLYGLNPAGHHLTNIILHAIVTITVYFFFLTFLSGNQWPALAGASLFALHPIHTHSVSYVMGRTDILAAVLYLWGLILLMKTREQGEGQLRTGMLLNACACYLLSLLCKEIAISLPLVFLLYCYCRHNNMFFRGRKNVLVILLSLLVTLGIYSALRVAAVGLTMQPAALSCWYSTGQRVWLVVLTMGFYLQKLLFPLHLCYYSNIAVPGGFWEETVRSSWFWTSMVWLATSAFSLRYSPQLGFALGWMGLTLLPVLNIVMLPDLAKEHYLYIPSIGFCLLFSLIVAAVIKRSNVKRTAHSRLAYIGIIMIGLFYGYATISRNGDYKDPCTFLERTITAMTPVPLHHREDPRYFEPVKNFYTSYRNLGILYQHHNQPQKALNAFKSALEYTPSYFSPHYGSSVRIYLGKVLARMERYEEALSMLQEARPAAANQVGLDKIIRTISVHMQENNVMAYDQPG